MHLDDFTANKPKLEDLDEFFAIFLDGHCTFEPIMLTLYQQRSHLVHLWIQHLLKGCLQRR